ncbi:MAG: SH3 domain-containing protein [Anaerolineales bacterium]
MFKLRSILAFLLCAMLLSTQAPATAQAAGKANFVTIYIDEITILGKSGDLTGAGEFRLIILAADTKGKSSGMFCPGDKPLKIRKGDRLKAPCLFGPSFNEAAISDGVYILVMAVDEDKSSLPADFAYEAASAGLGKVFGDAVKGGLVRAGLSTLAKSTPVTIAVSAVFSLATGKLKEWIQRADIIGSQGIYLSRKDNWGVDKTTSVTSKDGGIRITYTIVHTFSTPPNPKAPVLGSAPGTTKSTQSYWCDDLSYVKLKVGDRAKVVWLKVNLRTAPIVPMEYYENSIEKVAEGTPITIIGGPACAHEGTWWQVRTKKGQTGWMREYIPSSGEYLIGK